MKCYYHHTKDAVGVCRHCSKGICTDCLSDTVNGIACTNSCAEIMKAASKGKKIDAVGGVFGVLCIFVAGGMTIYLSYVRGEHWFKLFMGVSLVVTGIFLFIKIIRKNNGNT